MQAVGEEFWSEAPSADNQRRVELLRGFVSEATAVRQVAPPSLRPLLDKLLAGLDADIDRIRSATVAEASFLIASMGETRGPAVSALYAAGINWCYAGTDMLTDADGNSRSLGPRLGSYEEIITHLFGAQ